MSQMAAAQAKISGPSTQSQTSGVLQNKCNPYRQRKPVLQRAATGPIPEMTVPPIVHEVLRSSGQPLNREAREFMEPRFGHDFSRVRVHTDAKAAESAQSINALAYVIGQDLVFGEGQYNPGTAYGKRILAHELTHIIQQKPYSVNLNDLTISTKNDTNELEADISSRDITEGKKVFIKGCENRRIQRIMINEPAAGCGVCIGPQLAGQIAHSQVQAALLISPMSLMGNISPLREAEEPGSMLRRLEALGCGRPDIWIGGTEPDQIGEIKPANEAGYERGNIEMEEYINCFTRNGINVVPTAINPPNNCLGIFRQPNRPPGCPIQELFVNPVIGGIFGYYCQPTFRQIMRTGRCTCITPVYRPQEQEQEQEQERHEPTGSPLLVPVSITAAAMAFLLRMYPQIIFMRRF